MAGCLHFVSASYNDESKLKNGIEEEKSLAPVVYESDESATAPQIGRAHV